MNNWNPIEEAPKDGQIICVIRDGIHPSKHLPFEPCLAKWNSEDEYWEDVWGDMQDKDWELTHWMPLPK